MQIKTNIETLNFKLENAQQVINRNKRALNANAAKSGGSHGSSSLYGSSNNSQKFTEVNNLVGQLQEEFVNTTKGFKDVLRVRSDRMKERSDRRNNLMKGGASSANSPSAKRDGDDEDLALLGNKPKLYDSNNNSRDDLGSGMMKFSQMNDSNNSDTSAQQGGFGMGGPRLDLTSAIMSNQNEMGMPGGESTMQLPRPCKFFYFCLFVCLLNLHYFVYCLLCIVYCVWRCRIHFDMYYQYLVPGTWYTPTLSYYSLYSFSI
jgi:hypothetical protein